MSRVCRICMHPKLDKIDAELRAGYAIPGISVKHFGDASQVAALEDHKKHMRDLGVESETGGEEMMESNQTNGEEESEAPLTFEGEDVRRPENPVSYEQAPEGAIIACEPMRVKGVVYNTGEMIPESEWSPERLASALRVGTVKRKETGSAEPPPRPSPGEL